MTVLIHTPADYYSRYRPGLGAVLAGLTVFSCFVHYIFLYLTFRVAKLRIGQSVAPRPIRSSPLSVRSLTESPNRHRFRIQALEAAWGPTKKPLAGRKRLKVKTAEQGDPLGMPGVNDGRPIAAGATIEMVVEGEKVYIVENRKGGSLLPRFLSAGYCLASLLSHS